ncbi:MAG: TlpA disulfide reductase family protein [Elusimicrobiota bacterium]|nr:TlpA disulfide reductase family protein [Elusimicrobiota bacterium]
MRRLLPLAFLAAAVACADSGSREAPALALSGLDGGTMTLAEHRGRVVLVNFWATWCDSCREELPALNAIDGRLKGRPFALLSVSLDEAPAKVLPPFLKKHGVSYPVLTADDAVLRAWSVRGLPATFLIGPDGLIERRWLGPIDASTVENDILALLDRRPPK